MNKLKNSLPTNVLKLIYLSLVQSHLLYGLLVWGGEIDKTIGKRLVTLQKKGIRTITKSGYVAHTDPHFKELGLLKLTDMYKLQVIKMYCLALEKRTPDYIYFPSNQR